MGSGYIYICCICIFDQLSLVMIYPWLWYMLLIMIKNLISFEISNWFFISELIVNLCLCKYIWRVDCFREWGMIICKLY